eukprot:CCRYP_002833-RA/>CCRYP_002833-RA protein AED:0.00 eAED:0.00 QI:132/-1/1/1/-1/1/1/95/385
MIKNSFTSFVVLGGAMAIETIVEADALEKLVGPLVCARMLAVPPAVDVKHAEYEHASFWDNNGLLLRYAWEEWETSTFYADDALSQSLRPETWINSSLSEAIDKAFSDPSVETEAAVRSQWSNSYQDPDGDIRYLPFGVYATQLLNPSGVSLIRKLLDDAVESGIPMRRPNGMNRNGFILDRQVNGAIPIKFFMDFLEDEIINRVVRPVGRMLFKEFVGCNDDIEYFAFTIIYDGSEINEKEQLQMRDAQLNEHRDASVITMNINLNLPHEHYEGSDVFFRDFPESAVDNEFLVNFGIESPGEKVSHVKFSPGMAIVHLGAHRHGSSRILPHTEPKKSSVDTAERSGIRYNLVIWLFGKDGEVRVAPYSKHQQMDVVDRWRGCNH